MAAKEQNDSSQSSGRKNALQMLLEAQDENGVKVWPVLSRTDFCLSQSCPGAHQSTIQVHCAVSAVMQHHREVLLSPH